MIHVLLCATWKKHGVLLTKSSTPSWVFSRFLNCTNDTKSRTASEILYKNKQVMTQSLASRHFFLWVCFSWVLCTCPGWLQSRAGCLGREKSWGRIEAFDIYFCVLFGSYCQSLIFAWGTGHWLGYVDIQISPLATNLPSLLY